VRAAAARAVFAVLGRGRSLTEALSGLSSLADVRDPPLVQELSYGTVRLLPRLEVLAGLLMHKPLRPEEGELKALILVGLYQIAATRIPPHAAVTATVEATRLLGKDWAAGLVNALMRRFLRERARLGAQAERTPEGRWLFPAWLLGRLQAAWPGHWEDIVTASNARPPMSLRVNRLAIAPPDYAERLAGAGIGARSVPGAPEALVLEKALPARDLPGFDEGLVSVQDAGAQLAARLLGAMARERVLDACAAPGGKAAHVLELAGGELHLTALDSDPERLERVRENLDRLGLSARVRQGDAAEPGPWAEGPYDRVLLDVPCSATGVIRRHPDIKWLRRDTDIPALAARQRRMLDALWPLLAPGGTLLYVTCSLLPEENDQQVAAFLSRHPDARERPIEASWGLPLAVGRQTLPGEGGMDGFYYARLEKDVS
jgi:16S rRNA (cytosine967-C5)-methyltransferase